MRKKRILIALLIFFLIVLVAVVAVFLKSYSTRWNKKVEIEKYGVTLKYPRAYVDNKIEKSNVENLTSNILSTFTETEKLTISSIRQVEKVIDATSINSNINLVVEGIIKEKTKQPLEEICKNYLTMYQAFNEDYAVNVSEYEIVEIGGVQAGKVKIIFDGGLQKADAGSIAYLFPLDDREITVKFNGTNLILTAYEKEIERIINSIQFGEIDAIINSGDRVVNISDDESVSGEIESSGEKSYDEKSGEKENINI